MCGKRRRENLESKTREYQAFETDLNRRRDLTVYDLLDDDLRTIRIRGLFIFLEEIRILKLRMTKKTAQKSKIILTDIERRQKGVASTDGTFLYLGQCTFLNGLNSQYLFKAEGYKKVIQQLVSTYNQDFNASIPEGANPIDVVALANYYIASLPEPLTTFELYNEIKGARSCIHAMRNVLKKLPSVNYMTLEFVTELLLRVSQKSVLNKMDARSLAMEMAPVIMWQKDDGEDMDVSSQIPLDDGMPVDFGAIEAQVKGEASVLSSNVLLDRVGEVTLTLNSDGLSLKSLDSSNNGGSTCLGIKFVPKIPAELELIDSGMIQESNLTSAGECFLGSDSHESEVFVHPISGKANGRRTWETVAPIFSRAKVNTNVIVTQRAGHAFDVMKSTTNEELNSCDGAIAVCGDGFFNEILNGFLSSWHKAPFLPAPSDFLNALGNDGNSFVHDPNAAV
ncbi:hypothetical protein REPUB_Repub08aG0009400 [Reevesia pubescens]